MYFGHLSQVPGNSSIDWVEQRYRSRQVGPGTMFLSIVQDVSTYMHVLVTCSYYSQLTPLLAAIGSQSGSSIRRQSPNSLGRQSRIYVPGVHNILELNLNLLALSWQASKRNAETYNHITRLRSDPARESHTVSNTTEGVRTQGKGGLSCTSH